MKVDTSSLDSLYDLFYVAAYGCNRQCDREIRQVFYAHNRPLPSYMFFEFFAAQPLPKRPPEEWNPDWLKHVYLLTPFAPRLAQHSVLAPKIIKGEVKSRYRLCRPSQNANGMLTWALRFDESKAVRSVYDAWRGAPNHSNNDTKWKSVHDQATGETHYCGFVKKHGWRYIENGYIKGIVDPVSLQYAKALVELLRPMMSGDNRPVPSLMVPLCSSRLFYGAIWVLLPGLKGKVEDRQFLAAAALSLLRLVSRTYAPVLAVLHEHLLEKAVSIWSDDTRRKIVSPEPLIKYEIRARRGGIPVQDCWQHNAFYWLEDLRHNPGAEDLPRRIADDIETLLKKLWQRRARPNIWGNEDTFAKSLIFKSYLISSEAMAQLLYKVICGAKNLRKMNDTLPACLVIGGAGSGKEKLAKMIRLFSDDYYHGRTLKHMGYFRGKEFVVNLASIRPAPLTAAVVAGVDCAGIREGVLPAILSSAANDKGGKKRRTQTKPPTLRLDEFNSMDPDSQGVLLRFLDDSQVIALGGIEEQFDQKKTNCLVIGIMNEDPEDISREKALEFMKNPYLGGLLGDVLYEHFMKIRRLRPDVMYRMMRNGKFQIPSLTQRREDIPLLFYFFVEQEIAASLSSGRAIARKGNDTHRVILPLETLDRLLERDLGWPGNVRQLQAVAKFVAQRVVAKEPSEKGLRIVTLDIVEEALAELGLIPQGVPRQCTVRAD